MSAPQARNGLCSREIAIRGELNDRGRADRASVVCDVSMQTSGDRKFRFPG